MRNRLVGEKMNEIFSEHSVDLDVTKFGGRFPRTTCAYCKKEFVSREAMFRTHLDVAYKANLEDSKDPRHGNFAFHYDLKQPFARITEATAKVVKKWHCNAKNCNCSFDSELALNIHLRGRGTQNDWSKLAFEEEKASAAASAGAVVKQQRDAYLVLDECVICFEQAVSSMLMPCGHQTFCSPCATSIKSRSGSCPLCRGRVDLIVAIAL